jgi:hypothetical protein
MQLENFRQFSDYLKGNAALVERATSILYPLTIDAK